MSARVRTPSPARAGRPPAKRERPHARDASAPELAKTVRHAPKQERSRKRLDAIVEAAAELFAEVTFPEVTMDAIAQRAGTPIGSVYQFFDDKRAVFAAVMARSNDRARQAFGAIAELVRSEDLPLDFVLDTAIDAYVALQTSEPSIRAANLNFGYLGDLVAEDEALSRELATRTAQLVTRYYPKADARTRKRVATTLVDLVMSFLVIATRRGGAEARSQVAECKALARLYVRSKLGEPKR